MIKILIGDVRERLKDIADESINCIVTSPPYFGLRDYGVSGQIGLEPTPAEFVAELVDVFREARRVLRKDGTLWLNLGDSYAGGGTIGRNDTGPEALARRAAKYGTGTGSGSSVGSQGTRPPVLGLKPKDLIGIPWRVAFALQADGWYLRSSIIWHKPNPMPESVTDRPTSAHENIFLLSRAERYFYDADAVKEKAAQPLGEPRKTGQHKSEVFKHGGTLGSNQGDEHRNIRNVWTVATQPFGEAHFATFPPALIEPCIKAGCPQGGTVLDPFGGAGTTGLVADRLGRNAVLIELNPEYAAMAGNRLRADGGMFIDVTTEARP